MSRCFHKSSLPKWWNAFNGQENQAGKTAPRCSGLFRCRCKRLCCLARLGLRRIGFLQEFSGLLPVLLGPAHFGTTCSTPKNSHRVLLSVTHHCPYNYANLMDFGIGLPIPQYPQTHSLGRRKDPAKSDPAQPPCLHHILQEEVAAACIHRNNVFGAQLFDYGYGLRHIDGRMSSTNQYSMHCLFQCCFSDVQISWRYLLNKQLGIKNTWPWSVILVLISRY